MEKEQHRFSLETHLHVWRNGFSKTTLTKDDLDELTQHLSDHFEELVKGGEDEDEAWSTAVQTIGSHEVIHREFSKVWYSFLKNTVIFYILAFAPGAALLLLDRGNHSNWFLLAFGIYLFIYRTFVDFFRLRSKGIISKSDFWTLLLPGTRNRYFRGLYFS